MLRGSPPRGRVDLCDQDGNEREDKHRAEDRAWTLHQPNIEERRAIYAEMLELTNEINTWVVIIESASSELLTTLKASDELFERLKNFQAAKERANVAAVDQSVIQISSKYSTETNVALHSFG